ncbi:IS3 family transposase [Paenibacillus thiaminolyticus]|uniref:IS3 family transposase n=1 Tax=Paenibacillus thiaminolyticus TaxID=49283 RepID=UPI0035A64157
MVDLIIGCPISSAQGCGAKRGNRECRGWSTGAGVQGQEHRGKEYRGKEYRGKEYRGKEYRGKEYRGKEYRGNYLHTYHTFEDLERDIRAYIHYYNNERLQAKLNGFSPIEFRTKAA